MNPTLRFLVVGAGTMGGNYARLLASGRIPGAELAGIVDIDADRATALAGSLTVPAFASLGEAASGGANAAYIATPDALHREPVEALAAAGLHLLVEKPLATTNEDATAMIEAVNRTGVHAEVNYSNRWNPPFKAARKTVDDGDVGEPRSFNVRLNNPIASPRDRLKWSSSTTPAWFLMSHCLDLAHWLSGRRATSVFASEGRGVLAALGNDAPDWIHAVVSYEGGGDGVFESLWILPESWPGGVEFDFRMVGTRGAIDVNTTNQNIAVAAETLRYPNTIQWAPERLTSFVQAVNGEAGTTVSFEDGAEVTRVLVGVHESIRTGAPVQLP